jgi:hypothetical protein
MQMAAAFVGVALVALAVSAAWSQQNPIGGAPQQAPIGHRQLTIKDLPPDVAREQEQPADVSRGEPQAETVAAGARNARGRGGGPPTLQVGPSCEAAARGSVVLGRDKKACLSDETTAQDTLKQNWSKYAASDKNECIGMVTTGGPASYVELLSCVEILRDARNIRRADAFETDTTAASSRRRRRR